jgi:hypothetical protein
MKAAYCSFKDANDYKISGDERKYKLNSTPATDHEIIRCNWLRLVIFHPANHSGYILNTSSVVTHTN